MVAVVDIDVSSDTRSLLDAVQALGHGAALVGGCVRDALLGRPIRDIDIVTGASLTSLRTTCSRASWCRRIYDVGQRYGTVGVALDDGTVVEISTLRDSDLAADVAHRDFTVNTLAASWPSLVVLDHTGGIEDLRGSLLRAPGDPVERFAEDPLRVLRAARFVAELGFTLDANTEAGAVETAPRLAEIAVERVRDELTKLLMGGRVVEGLNVALSTGALAVVLPEVARLSGVEQPSFHDLDVFSHTTQTTAVVPARMELRWAALLHDIGKPECSSVDPDGRLRFLGHAPRSAELAALVCERLRFSRAQTRSIVHLVGEHMRLSDLAMDNPRAVDRAVRRLDLRASDDPSAPLLVSAEDALELAVADFAATAHRDEAPTVRARLASAIAESRERGTLKRVTSPLSGQELMAALRLEPGPAVGSALRAIEDAIAQGTLSADDRDAALGIARQALAMNGESSGDQD
jgi:poly(A) polymerase